MEDVTAIITALAEALSWLGKMTDHDLALLAGQLQAAKDSPAPGIAVVQWDNSYPLGFLESMADLCQTAAYKPAAK